MMQMMTRTAIYPLKIAAALGVAFLLWGLVLAYASSPASAATINVNTTADTKADDGKCSLREAITSANKNTASGAASGECAAGSGSASDGSGSGSDLINLGVKGTMNLTGALPDLESAMEIKGPGADQLTVRRDETTLNYGFFTDYSIFTLWAPFTCGSGSCGSVPIDVSISGITISNGKNANAAGGILNTDDVSLTISGCTISGNSAGGSGGGIANQGTLTVSGSTISGNSADAGGGIDNFLGTLTISGSTISGNTATFAGGGSGGGGGVENNTHLSDPDQKTTITNSTISGNTATNRGGGFYNVDGRSVIENSTITNNTAPSGKGSGVASYGDTSTSTEVLSTIISANQGTDVDFAEDTTINSFLSKGYNLIGSGNATGAFNQSTDQPNEDVPKLGPLADNGGPTKTHALLAGSPAVDKGNTDLGTDQRGQRRPFDDPSIAPATGGDDSDIGSFEAQSVLIELNSAPKATDDTYSTKEDTTLTLDALDGVLSNDTDSNSGDTLTVAAPRPLSGPANGTLTLNENGSFTYTPNANYNGIDGFTYKASDGKADSAIATVNIAVKAVNDAPSFTAGADQTVAEDSGAQSVSWASAISQGPNESGQQLTFEVTNNTDPGLFSAGPSVAPNGPLSYTPALNENGSATISVRLKDDGGTPGDPSDDAASTPQTFTITVTEVNDAPVAQDDAASTNEDQDLVISNPGTLTANDDKGAPNESGQTLSISSVSNASHGTINLSGGTITFTPAADYSGSTSFDYQVCDDGTTNGSPDHKCDTGTVSVTVNPVNDPPQANDGTESMNEDAAPINIDLGALASDEETTDANLTYTIVNGPSAQQGTLTGSGSTRSFDSAENFNGSASFTYKVTDRGDPDNCSGAPSATCTENKDSATKTVTITVTAVNDAPSFTKGANETVLEDSGTAGAHSVPNWVSAISAGPADENGQQLTFHVTSNTNSSLFSTEPSVSSTGTLTYTLASDANGEAEVTLSLKDDGGTANGGGDTSAVQTFKITVTAVNDAPSFQLKANPGQTVLEDSGAHSVENFATNFSAGPSNESGQALLKYVVSNTNNSLFTSTGQPSIDATTGKLTYTLAPGAIGTATVSVMAQDDGGTANGGVDTSAAKTFKITLKYNFSGFLSPIPLSSYKVGSTIPVKFALANASGTKISDAAAQDLARQCKVKVLFSGGTPANNCATYNAKTDTFQFNLKISKSLAPGNYTISVEISAPDGSMVNKESVEVNIRR